MERLDAFGRELERLALRRRHLDSGRPPVGIGYAQARRVGVDPVELARVVDHRRVTARTYVGDDVGHDLVDILVGVAIARQEGGEVLVEARRRGVEPKRHDSPRGSDRPSGRPAAAAS